MKDRTMLRMSGRLIVLALLVVGFSGKESHGQNYRYYNRGVSNVWHPRSSAYLSRPTYRIQPRPTTNYYGGYGYGYRRSANFQAGYYNPRYARGGYYNARPSFQYNARPSFQYNARPSNNFNARPFRYSIR